MGALGLKLTPFCSVCCQFFSFIPSIVPMSFRSHQTMSIQFFLGPSGFLLYPFSSYCIAWRGILESSILNTCPSHLSLLSLMTSSNFHDPVFFLISSFLSLSFHEIPNSLHWNLWWAASSFFICTTGSGKLCHLSVCLSVCMLQAGLRLNSVVCKTCNLQPVSRRILKMIQDGAKVSIKY